MKYTLPLPTSLGLSPPQVVCNYFILLLIMFPLWLAIVIVLFFCLAIDRENLQTSFSIVIMQLLLNTIVIMIGEQENKRTETMI